MKFCAWRAVHAAASVLVLVGCFASTAVADGKPASADNERLAQAELDAIVDETVARYRLPGIAVGVIEEGKVIYMGTRGETISGSGQPITSNTLFKIASNSKAMTASVLARLVDAGKLRWEDPVIKYLPSFRMYDPWVTRNMQVKDLMLWPEPNHFTRADIIAGLAHIKPAYSFRSGYAYDNLLYVVAGEVAAAAGGASYEELVQRELFQPLGLSRCRVGEWRSDQLADVAQPHASKDGRNRVTNADGATVEPLVSAAAGGIRCSVNDMLVWAQNWLVPDAKQQAWLSAEQRQAAWVPRTPMPISARRHTWDGTRLFAYGYGWRIADVDGAYTVSHTGTLSGMYSVMTLLPDRRSGFVVLINGEAESARTVLNEVLLKRFTRPNDGRGVAYYADELARESASKPPAGEQAGVARETPALSELVPWQGVYRDPWFGEVRVCAREGKMGWVSEKSPMLSGSIRRSDSRYLVDWDNDRMDTEAWLDFRKGEAGQPTRLTMAKVDPEADFSSDFEDLAFERVRDCD